MKTRILFVILALFSFVVTQAQTAIPDPNFEAALRARGLDGNGPANANNGFVDTGLIQAVTTLNLQNETIFSFNGLQDFTALVTLVNNGSHAYIIDNPFLQPSLIGITIDSKPN